MKYLFFVICLAQFVISAQTYESTEYRYYNYDGYSPFSQNFKVKVTVDNEGHGKIHFTNNIEDVILKGYMSSELSNFNGASFNGVTYKAVTKRTRKNVEIGIAADESYMIYNLPDSMEYYEIYFRSNGKN